MINNVEYVYIESSTFCNLECVYCHRTLDSYNYKNKNMEYDIYVKIISQLLENRAYIQGANLFLHGFGEPTFNINLCKFVSKASETHLFSTIQFVSNISCTKSKIYHQCFERGLTDLYISIDSTSLDYLSKTRVKTNYKLLFENFKELASCYSNKIKVITVITKDNISHLPEIANLLDQYSIQQWNLQLLHKYGNKFEFSSEELEFISSLLNLSKCKVNLEGRPYPKCNQPNSVLVFNVVGDVMPCCIDFSGQISCYGNIHNASLKEIFSSSIAQSFIKNFNDGNSELCNKCAYYGK